MSEILKPNDLNIIWASNGVATAPSTSKYLQGWVVEAPPYQTENYINQRTDITFAHINQHGMPQWDSATEYQANKSWTLGTNGALYFCKVTHINTNPVSDVSESRWRKVLDGNLVINKTQVSDFALTFLDDTSGSAVLDTLGSTSLGKNLLTATSPSAGRSFLGATSLGDGLFTAGSSGVARTLLGSSGVGDALFTSSSNAVARGVLGATSLGSNLFTSPSPISARANLGATGVGDTLFTTATPDDARISLGASAIGNALFVVPNTTSAQNLIGLVDATDTVSGKAERATDAEAITGTDDIRFLTPRKLKLGFSFTAGSIGHLSFPSWMGGFILQWGEANVGANTSQSATMARSFPSSCLQGVCSLGFQNVADTNAPKCTPSGTSLILSNSQSNTQNIRWFAIGN